MSWIDRYERSNLIAKGQTAAGWWDAYTDPTRARFITLGETEARLRSPAPAPAETPEDLLRLGVEKNGKLFVPRWTRNGGPLYLHEDDHQILDEEARRPLFTREYPANTSDLQGNGTAWVFNTYVEPAPRNTTPDRRPIGFGRRTR